MCTKSFLRLSLVIVFSISLSACQDAETEVIKNPLPEKTTQLHANFNHHMRIITYK